MFHLYSLRAYSVGFTFIFAATAATSSPISTEHLVLQYQTHRKYLSLSSVKIFEPVYPRHEQQQTSVTYSPTEEFTLPGVQSLIKEAEDPSNLTVLGILNMGKYGIGWK
jgi:hypothetical protein